MDFFKWLRPRKRDSEQVSFSQSGEDLIVDFVLSWMGISEISYLDLGANDPLCFNNTYRLYEKGHTGVLVEPDVTLSEAIRKLRPKDICVACAVGVTHDPEVSFYKMSADTLSTTQSNTVDLYEKNSEHRLTLEVKVPQMHINALLAKYFPEKAPIFVSLDVEGLDLQLLEAWNFSRWRPSVICVETLTYSQNKTATKVLDIFKVMELNGYEQYADTYINTIFVNKADWDRRTG
ncbi:hypothetical protein A7976_07390 [Methylobacillus sp. MM3]|nr:hypothetical protein A7976_07390 [Methylobacillus sp. MM3]